MSAFADPHKVAKIRTKLEKRHALYYQGNYFWPSSYGDLLNALLTCSTFDYRTIMDAAAVVLEDQTARIEALEQALRNVCDPVGYLRRKAEAEGGRLNELAYSIGNDLNFVQGIARAALAQTGEPTG